MHDGLPRAYRIHLPPKLVVGAPLVIQLHGGGGNGRGIDRLTRFHALADRGRFAVVSPSGIGHRWNDGRVDTGAGEADTQAAPGPSAGGAAGQTADDVGFLTTLIDCVAAWLPIDRHRVYLVGISNGAMMSARLAAERPELVAAIGQVAGTAPVDARHWWHPARPVPVIQIHGTADPILPYASGEVQLRRRQRGGHGQVLGVDEWADLLVATNQAAAGATGTSPPPDVTTTAPGVTVRTWRGQTPEADVQFWRVEGGGHTWPGGIQYLPERMIGPTSHAFDATAAIWRFLAAHIRAP